MKSSFNFEEHYNLGHIELPTYIKSAHIEPHLIGFQFRILHYIEKNCNHYQKIITLTATHSEEKTTTNARHAPAAGEHLGSSPWYYDANIINGKIAPKIVI